MRRNGFPGGVDQLIASARTLIGEVIGASRGCVLRSRVVTLRSSAAIPLGAGAGGLWRIAQAGTVGRAGTVPAWSPPRFMGSRFRAPSTPRAARTKMNRGSRRYQAHPFPSGSWRGGVDRVEQPNVVLSEEMGAIRIRGSRQRGGMAAGRVRQIRSTD